MYAKLAIARLRGPAVALCAFALCGALSLSASPASAAVPQTVAVQAALHSLAGGPVADGDYILSFSLFVAETGGEALWTEGPSVVTVGGGHFTWALGNKAPLAAVIGAADGPLWLEARVGNDPPLARRALASVTTALRAAVADAISCSGCVTADHLAAEVLAPYVKQASLPKVALSGAYADLEGLPAFAKVAMTGSYFDLGDLPQFAAVAMSGNYNDLEGLPSFAKVATTGAWADVAGKPVTAAVGTACGAGKFVVGLSEDGTLDCAPAADPNGALAPASLVLPSHDAPPFPCDAGHAGHVYLHAKQGAFYGCNGKLWAPMTAAAASTSCAALLANNPGLESGIYEIDPDGSGAVAPSEVYCDMTNGGGGWTLLVRLNTNDATSRVYGDNAFWDAANGVGKLDGNDDWMAPAAASLGFTELRLVYDYKGPATISAHYKHAGNTDSLRKNLGLAPSNANPAWARTASSAGVADAFFGTVLRFQTIGNDNDNSRIWYNLVPVAACNQGGSIGHIGDAGSNGWTWEVARGSDLDPGDCQHNTYKLGLGSNYDKKSWGGTPIEPAALYSEGVMRIFVR